MTHPELLSHSEVNPEFRAGLERGNFDRRVESFVMRFYESSFPNTEVRPALKQEDEGLTGFRKGQAIDAVMYMKGEPTIGLQITATRNEDRRMQKIQEIKDYPFLRLPEMKPQDHAIPRVLIWLDPEKMKSIEKYDQFQREEELTMQILNSTLLSLRFDLMQTQNPSEQERLQALIDMVEQERKKAERTEA